MRPRYAPVLVALVLALVGIGHWPLWQDEAFTWALIQKGFGDIVDGAAGDRHPPLYYLLVAPLRVFGDRDELVRLPSALAFVAAVWIAGSAARRHFGDHVGSVVGFAIALSPVALLHANNARMYALLLLWGAALLAGGLELVCGDRPRRGALVLGLAAAGAVWTHYAGLAAIAAGGAGAALGCLARVDLPWKARFGRVGWLVLAFGIAGVSFLPWATGPLQFQLTNKDAPAERTLTVLAYALWNFDTRVPPLSVALVVAQIAGLVVLLRRRDPPAVVLGVWALGGLVLPWVLSRSLPAQNPRNYLDFLPAAAMLVGLATQRFPRVAVGLLAIFAAEPLWDLLTRRVSPQETGVGFDYQLEADVFDASVPKNAGFYFRPTYMLTQYRRYAPDLEIRTTLPVDANAWIASPRTEWLDSSITARYTEACTFRQAFRVVVYAPDGPGCEAMAAWVQAGAEAGYAPFRIEMGTRALAANRVAEAEEWVRPAAEAVRAHPAAWITLTDVRLRAQDGAGMLLAADEALAAAKAWHFPGRVIGGVHNTRARALAMLARDEEAAAARAAATCAQTSQLPAICGTWAAPFVPTLPPLENPPPTLPPLPALTEPQDAAPPVDPPRGATRLSLWALDGEALPAGWADGIGTPDDPSATMEPVDAFTSLVLRVRPDRAASVVCATLVDAAPRMTVRARWKLGADGPAGWTRLVLEARLADAEGNVKKLLDQPMMERPLQTATPTTWRVDRFDFRTTDAAKVRLCAKLEGKVPATASIDWIEIGRVDE
ncbi:MAG: glycosyltransferase family 39 protein [Pseudomonadota bacterium]|nr:glycosyltransferase family 39 protein [Pseudomonadota bacterium]